MKPTIKKFSLRKTKLWGQQFKCFSYILGNQPTPKVAEIFVIC